MKLQILIPHYKEPYEMVCRLLVSIAQQQNINFDDIGVIICNDGNEVLLPKDKLQNYPFSIEYIIREHGGPSVARQACLDNASAEYVMFCDSDDMFIDMLGLWYVFGDIINSNFDIIVSTFVEETMNDDTNELAFVKIEKDEIFLHGKIFRRQFLLDNNISFNQSLTVHEDEYFVSLSIGCLQSQERYDYFDNAFYLWRWNDESITRKDTAHFMLKTYTNLIDVFDSLVSEFLLRQNMTEAKHYCIQCFYNTFYTMNESDWLEEENIAYREKTEKRFSSFYKKYIDLFDSADQKYKIFLGNRIREAALTEGFELEVIAFPDWLDHIKELSKQLPE